MEKKWWKESVVYQIYPKSFQDSNNDGIGDIQGIIQRLDYLKNLGVDILWISPMYVSPQVDNGYDIADYYQIDPMFGTMKDFDMLLEEAHSRGLKIVMDLVVNHTSDQHEWFQQSRLSTDNKYRDYYIWKKGKNNQEPTNWESIFSGSAWEYDELTDMYYLHLYSSKQPDLNWDNVDMRNDIYKMMKFWLDKGIDGFRMDVINKISKAEYVDVLPQTSHYMRCSKYTSNGPRIHEFLQEMNKKVISQYDAMTVGEITACSIEQAIQYTSDYTHELNMLFQFEHNDVDSGQYGKWTPIPLDLVKLKRIMEKWQIGLMHEGWNSLFWDNHDQPRIVSRFGNTSTPQYWKDSAKMLAVTLHMMKGTPYIYQGEELGMTNYPFQDLEDCVDVEVFNNYKMLVLEKKVLTHEQMMKGICYSSRDNARTPMQWDNSIYAGFSKTTPWMNVNPNYHDINALSQMNNNDSIYSFYQKLIQLRREYDVIVYGDFELLEKEHPHLFIYRRYDDKNEILVISNFTNQELIYEFNYENYEILLSNDKPVISKTFCIKAYGTYILKRKS
ncbi:MAG: alpha-glucosidase [Erysipelotrichales bacterium]|nr:alpha-glucosidase [Erysipelotrichales bacterium]